MGDDDKGSSDDGCIGNRRVRTILLSIIIGVFFVFASPFAQSNESDWRDGGDLTESYANAWAFIFAGCIICIVGAIAAVLLFIIPGCDDKLGRVAGFVLIIGGIVYMIGWIWWVVKYNEDFGELAKLAGEDAERQFNARLAAWIGEALLAGGSAILLGLDAAFKMYGNEAFRLSSNLGIICTVSSLCIGAYYAQICGSDDTLCTTPDGVEMIATGYLILFWICLIYIILYICTCCTCDCKDKCMIRLVIAITLVIGGVLTAIGYYVFVGADKDSFDSDTYDSYIVYFVGYSILIAGLSIVWALDMVFDDVKNR